MKTLAVLLLLSATAFGGVSATYFGLGKIGPNSGLHGKINPREFYWTGTRYAIKFYESENIYQVAPYWGPRYSGADVFTDSVESLYAGNSLGNTNGKWSDTIAINAHANGAYALEDIHQVGNVTGWNYVIADSARFEAFIESVRSWCAAHGYDGVETNLEQWGGTINSLPNHLRALRQIRRAMNRLTAFDGTRGKFFCCAPAFDGTWYPASHDTCWDVLAYNGYSWYGATYSSCGGNQVWYMSPLHRGTDWCPAHNEAGSIVEGQFFNDGSGLNSWVAAGHDKAKILIGVNSYAIIAAGVTDIRMAGSINNNAEIFYDEFIAMASKGGTLVRDTVAKEEYYHGTNTTGSAITIPSGQWWMSSQTINAGQSFTIVGKSIYAIQQDAQYSNDNGYMGVWVYDAWKGCINTASTAALKYPLFKALGDALGNCSRGTITFVR